MVIGSHALWSYNKFCASEGTCFLYYTRYSIKTKGYRVSLLLITSLINAFMKNKEDSGWSIKY